MDISLPVHAMELPCLMGYVMYLVTYFLIPLNV
jgi:hypothetical protein